MKFHREEATDVRWKGVLDECAGRFGVPDGWGAGIRPGCAAAVGRQGGVGHVEGAPRHHPDARAGMHQRSLAMATGKSRRHSGPGCGLGFLQGPRPLAPHAERLADRLPPRELARRGHERNRLGLVPARDRRAEGMGRTAHHALRGVCQFERRRLPRRRGNRHDPVPRRRARPYRQVPPRREATPQSPREGDAVHRGHARLRRHELREAGERLSRPPRPLRRRSTSSARRKARASSA